MCEKCNGIDAKISHYRQLLAGIDDQAAIALVKLVIEDLESHKVGLHPKDK
jgi:hypothetical protein